mmetsp:Transcript_31585/g.52138  ORF Transcript_31585/g.52138 Transcript_31585/m.52138 type:complete len:371 (-) Transcript_31585:233-1345(-)|eukprot:CAMPEP_0119010536 /NCGR_PEP_ID=MMETSP1176-20130426/5080_1 /TAXON_ID=265551 /ORGANISM="Synedropsis recta cf, Strain CCMP1620" /LENGTH=370 /DNA_ID=CAMNT_0006963211 /DNA_START=142 /DNA_END=1254 /DNA_ORIENTATION=-
MTKEEAKTQKKKKKSNIKSTIFEVGENMATFVAKKKKKQKKGRQGDKKKREKKKKDSTKKKKKKTKKEKKTKKKKEKTKIETTKNMTAKQAEKVYPATIHMFSGCEDAQTSADVKNVEKTFGNDLLYNPAGKSGGACTFSLLEVLHKHHENDQETSDDLTYRVVLKRMRYVLKKKGYTQRPQLSSSRNVRMSDKFDLIPDTVVDKFVGKMFGKKRALLIGINYEGHDKGALSGCHNDVKNWKKYIKEWHGFKNKNIRVLMDDGDSISPTRANILAAYKKIVKESKRGDVVFCHYSGHGGSVRDISGDEEDGRDETMIPVDYKENGQILDDELNEILCKGFKKGVYSTFIYDCCHSASILDLPYEFKVKRK